MTTFNFNTLCAGRSLTTEESQALFTQVFEGKIDPALLRRQSHCAEDQGRNA